MLILLIINYNMTVMIDYTEMNAINILNLSQRCMAIYEIPFRRLARHSYVTQIGAFKVVREERSGACASNAPVMRRYQRRSVAAADA